MLKKIATDFSNENHYTEKNIESIINFIKETIVTQIKPQKIILFGSTARGQFGRDSDVDLLVIYHTTLRRDQRARQIKDLFRPYPIPMDILAYTPAEVAQLSQQQDTFFNEILHTGKIIYDYIA